MRRPPAILTERPTYPAAPSCLAAAAGLHEKHSVWRHIAVLVEARLLLEHEGLYRLNRRSPLRRPLLDLIVALERVPPRRLPRSRGG